MIGSFLSRVAIMMLGYVYPAYECYKAVEMNKPEIEQLRFWCQYWILVALLSVFERIGDAFISWLPMYSEAKLAFFIYLWYPKTKGTRYVYDAFFRPFVSKHETEIDRNLLEFRTRAGDVAVLCWQKSFSYGQKRVFEVLQYVALQPKPETQSGIPDPVQHPQNNFFPVLGVQQQPQIQTVTLEQQQIQTATMQQPPPEPPPVPSSPAKRQLQGIKKESDAASPSKTQKSPGPKRVDTRTDANRSSERLVMQANTVSTSPRKEELIAEPEERIMDDAVRRTRVKLRKRPPIGGPSATH